MKLRTKKGFTLMEMLIVVAIIAILVAISIPIFTSQLERSREQTDIANMRSAKSLAVALYLAGGAIPDAAGTGTTTIDPSSDFTANYDATEGILTEETPSQYGKGTAANGGTDTAGFTNYVTDGTDYTNQYITVSVASGVVTVNWAAVSGGTP